MFFADRIKSISPNDRVLEIGPGATPHPRSDVFLELSYGSEEEEQEQFGHTGRLKTDKEIVFYDGAKFPFEDNSFDYIICSHVLEHVPDVKGFLKELFRVGKKGYLEYPNIYYDYLFNFDVHKNFLRKEHDHLKWMKKSATSLDDFKLIQNDLYERLNSNHFRQFIQNNREFLFEGYEWFSEFELRECDRIDQLTHPRASDLSEKPAHFDLENYVQQELSFKKVATILFRKITRKFK